MRPGVVDIDQAHERNISQYSEGDDCFRQGRYREALKLFKAALDADPTDGDSWHAIGSCYDALGKPARAAAAYRHALPHLPADRHPDIHFNIGNSHLDLGQYADALVHYDLVPRASPVWPASARNRALALQRLGGAR